MGAFLLAIKAWSIWSRLGAWFATAASWASRNPWPALAIVLLIGNVVQWHIHKVELAHDAAIAAAQKSSTAAQITVNQAPAIASAQLARQSDATAPAYYGAVAGAAAAHDSIVRSGACTPGPADLPRPDPAAPVNDRPAVTPELVSRPKPDDDLIVAAAGRAAKMHQDAADLIARGLAVPDDAPTPATAP